MNSEEIIDTVSHLPVDQRAKIADGIIKTFNKPDRDIQKAQIKEIKQRKKRYEKGKTQGIPGEQVMKEAKERLGK